MFLTLNSLMGGKEQTVAKSEAIPAPVPTPFEKEQDGEVYAKLALQKQQSDLKDLNGTEGEDVNENDELATEAKNNNQPNTLKKSTTTTLKEVPTTNKPVQTTQTPPTRTVARTTARNRTLTSQSNSSRQPQHQTQTASRVSSKSPTPAVTIPKVTLPTNSQKVANKNTNSSNSDPLADIARLTSLGSLGRVNYQNSNTNTIVASNIDQDDTNDVSPETLDSRRRRSDIEEDLPSSDSNNENQLNENEGNDSEIQQLTPRWEPSTANKTDKETRFSQLNLVSTEYLSEESQILEEQTVQYLVVGSTTQATLITPLIVAQDKPNKNLRFIAQLNEPIKAILEKLP
ncbi:MAG: hypothetical protein HC815_05910 [Richelia sp. RM1_1_1]|nr:hypothetical protein [Richelia sp. RM1_1_1]